jgi:hypothetical protein
VFKLDDFTADSTLVGYIFGGIASTAENIFFINTGIESEASSQIFKVYVIRNTTVGNHQLNKQSVGNLKMQVLPNPSNGNFALKFNLDKIGETKLIIYNVEGKEIQRTTLTGLNIGENIVQQRITNPIEGGTYLVTIETTGEKASQKIVIGR